MKAILLLVKSGRKENKFPRNTHKGGMEQEESVVGWKREHGT